MERWSSLSWVFLVVDNVDLRLCGCFFTTTFICAAQRSVPSWCSFFNQKAYKLMGLESGRQVQALRKGLQPCGAPPTINVGNSLRFTNGIRKRFGRCYSIFLPQSSRRKTQSSQGFSITEFL